METNDITHYINAIEAHGLTVETFGGNCPVQVHAHWSNGNHLYFRARGTSWSIAIATNEDDAIDGDHGRHTILYYSEGTGIHAGYMPLCDVTAIVLEAINEVEDGQI